MAPTVGKLHLGWRPYNSRLSSASSNTRAFMSVIVLCPSCGVATPFHRPPVATCPHCHAVLPEAVVAPAERALAVDQAPKPVLLQVGMIGSLVFGVIVVFILVLAPFNLGSYSINGEAVSGPEFFREAGLLFGTLGILMLVIGLGLWLERAWTRMLMMGYWGVLAVAGVAQLVTGSSTVGDAIGFIVESLIALALAGWYLYGKDNVVAYYQRLEHVVEPAREDATRKSGESSG